MIDFNGQRNNFEFMVYSKFSFIPKFTQMQTYRRIFSKLPFNFFSLDIFTYIDTSLVNVLLALQMMALRTVDLFYFASYKNMIVCI